MKGRVIMHISPKQMLFIVIYLVANCLLAGFLWLVRENTLGIPVVNYHQINDTDHNAMTVTTEEFEREMAYLEANGYHAITPDQLVSYLHGGNKLPDKPVLITFDDGYEDNYLNAYPILKKHGFTATIFLISDYMGRFDKYLQWYQVKEMSADGFYMGCHTLSHYELTELSPDSLKQQLNEGKLAVEWQTLEFAEYIAYPCGSYNDGVLEAVNWAGYRGGFTVRYGLVKPGDSPYLMNRVPIFGGSGNRFLKFRLRLLGAPFFGPLERFRANLIASGHPTLANFILLP